MSIPANLTEYEALARERLSPMVYDYYAGGANDEVTLTENMRSWRRMRLRPRALVDVSRIDPTTTVLGHPVAMPVLTAPCSFNMLAHPEGECAVARAASAARHLPDREYDGYEIDRGDRRCGSGAALVSTDVLPRPGDHAGPGAARREGELRGLVSHHRPTSSGAPRTRYPQPVPSSAGRYDGESEAICCGQTLRRR